MPILFSIRRRAALSLLAAACLLGGTVARADAWPSRPVTLIVSFEPGGSTDISARAVAQALSVELKQPVVVENRAGAGGRIGTKAAAMARPDGYTLLWGSGSSLTAAPAIYPNQEHVATLVPVSLGATQAFVFVTNPGLGVRTVQEFVALAKREPGKLNFASAGAGSSNHLLGEIFLAATGAPVVHVPYKGAVMAKDAVIRGEAQLMDEVTSPLIGALRAGQLVPLFMTGERRDPAFPDIPTAAEAGLPEMTIQGFFGLLAPAGTPPEIVARLNATMRAALASEPVARTFGNLGFITVYSTPGQMAARIAEGRATYDRIVKARQIRVD